LTGDISEISPDLNLKFLPQENQQHGKVRKLRQLCEEKEIVKGGLTSRPSPGTPEKDGTQKSPTWKRKT